MPDAKRRTLKWRQWAILLLVSAVIVAWFFSTHSPIQRAKKIQSGMTRSEVHQIMGPSQLRFKEGGMEIGGSVRIEAGECWDYGGAFGAWVDHFKRKLGLLNTFKIRSQYPVEIRFDGLDRVQEIEIRANST